jgi:NitT/TauT family transport system substrate-binding protein
MRLTGLGKIVLLILAVGAAIGGYRIWQNRSAVGGGDASGMPPDGGVGQTTRAGGEAPSNDQGLLGRPLRVGVVTWPGYAGGITANNGFRPNRDSIYWNNHRLLVEFMLMEDVDARAKAFARGGRDGVDIVWSTVDFWANELPGFIKGGVPARAIMQVDWSRGGDAIVADQSIRKIEDLRGKLVSLALFTPSHWLLEYSLENSSLDETAQSQIVKSIVGKNASPDARQDFVSRKVHAAVVWEPDVTEALRKRPGSHVLVSTKTAANLIADLMVAREDFIRQHPAVIKAFIQGWFDGTVEANRNNEKVIQLLMQNEPLYKELGEAETRAGLATVKWADLADNARMFGLDGSEPLFDRIFRQASRAWVKRGYISQPVLPAQAKNDRFLRDLYAAVPREVRPQVPKEEFKFPPKAPAAKRTQAPIMTKPVNIFFGTGSAQLDPNSRQVLDQVALTAQTYSNAYLRVEGNTDSTGNPQRNVALSAQRAESVVNYLVKRYGFSRGRFITKGNGPNKPVAPNATAEGRARNRRTDILVVPR